MLTRLTRPPEDILEILRADGPILAVKTRRGMRAPHYRFATTTSTLYLDPIFLRAPIKTLRDMSTALHPARGTMIAGQHAARRVISWYNAAKPSTEERIADLAHYRKVVNPRCDGTPEQHHALLQLYDYLNTRLFGRRLPAVSIILNGKMSLIGYMLVEDGQPSIGLNLALMRPGRMSDLRWTLIHEMCHLATLLFDGEEFHASGREKHHGPGWQKWMRYVGLEPKNEPKDALKKAIRDDVTTVPVLPADCAAVVRSPLHPVLVMRGGQPMLRLQAARTPARKKALKRDAKSRRLR